MATGQFQGRVIGQKEVGPQRQFVGLKVNEGANKLKAVLKHLGDQAPDLMGMALYRQAEFLMTDAKRITPVDQGPLRASGHVDPVRVEGSKVEVIVGFGGVAGTGNHNGETNNEDVGYAAYVHEDLNARHTTGEAKYLERPALELAGKLEGNLARDLKQDVDAITKS